MRITFLKPHLHHFSEIKVVKKSQNSRNQGFFYYFWLMIEESGVGSGSVPRTNGSIFRRPKILRIRIRNTEFSILCITFFSWVDREWLCHVSRPLIVKILNSVIRISTKQGDTMSTYHHSCSLNTFNNSLNAKKIKVYYG